MPLWQSLLFVGIIPGAFAGVTVAMCTSRWALPWWGKIGVGFGGWLIGFVVVALVGRGIELLARGRKAP